MFGETAKVVLGRPVLSCNRGFMIGLQTGKNCDYFFPIKVSNLRFTAIKVPESRFICHRSL